MKASPIIVMSNMIGAGYRLILIALLVQISSPVSAQATAPPRSPLASAIEELFARDMRSLPLPVRQEQAALQAYYLTRNGQPLWRTPVRMREFVEALKHADRDGLNSADYPTEHLERLSGIAGFGGPRSIAQVELYFSAILLRFARDLKVGRFLPTKIDPKLYWQEKRIDPLRALMLFARARDTGTFISQWQPGIADYANLKALLAAYRRIEAAGGWPAVPHVDAIRPGEQSPVVATIHARLERTDEEIRGRRDPASPLYDDVLVTAVKRFQSQHGLEPDGVIGKRTIFAMNIPVSDRIHQIVVTMERWRWMPEDLGQSYIRVNIAGYELRRVRNGRLEERMRVVVGKPYHQTPVFSDEIEYLELNPYWNVPHSIAINEELPKLKANPAARAARDFEAVIDGRGVSLTSIDWTAMSRSNFPVRLRQKPGPHNALGRVKFMFPNRFNVYLHDTPSRSLFSRAQRAFSHGCIRLARPIDLAEQLVADVPGWDRQRIDRVLEGRERTVVRLSANLPVHLTYATVWIDGEGDVQFRPDIYQRDAKLEQALAGRYARL
jgi:murein L,D-transpeptidase YcbB/YkuD